MKPEITIIKNPTLRQEMQALMNTVLDIIENRHDYANMEARKLLASQCMWDSAYRLSPLKEGSASEYNYHGTPFDDFEESKFAADLLEENGYVELAVLYRRQGDRT